MTVTNVPAVEAADRRTVSEPAAPRRRRIGRPSRSGWITISIAAVTALLYTWGLGSSGYANSYYAAAVRAMSSSWKAFFYGALDPGSFITVDKPPAALWLQALSARAFGFSSWSMLLPQALAGVGSVLILHHLVRRWAGDTAAHLAALAFACTPVAVLMFRYNNPDAFLTFLGLAAAWSLWSAVESGRTRMLVLAAALTGLAFQTKMLQAFLVLPAFILVYLVAGPPRLGRRIAQLAVAATTLVVSAGWWVAVVALVPASSRPYIGSTTDNSILSLVFGYNGLSRLFGGQGPGGRAGPGGGAGGGGNVGFGGTPGWLRMFNPANGAQISWLLPLAAIGLVAGLWATRRRPRTDRTRAGWLLWGGWALVCSLAFSKAQGIFHPYYTVQLAPALAALAGAGGVTLWRLGRSAAWLRTALSAAVVLSAGWAVSLLARIPTFASWLRPTIIVGALAAAAGLWMAWALRSRLLLSVSAGVAALALLAGPAAYALATAGHANAGPIVAAGPATGGAGDGAGGRLGGGAAVDSGLVTYLEQHRDGATYLVAALGSGASAPIIIATGEPVVTVGGFNGGDPAPTLAQFQQMVATGSVRFILIGGMAGGGGPGGGGNGSGEITQWVTQHATSVPAAAYGGTGSGGTLYDLSGLS